MKIRKRLYLPERIVFVIIFFILIIFAVQPSKAQPPFYPQNRPMLRSDSQGACWQSSDLALTEAQTRALESLQRDYTTEALPLRRELMSLRVELRYSIRDSNVQPKGLLDRQKKILELQMRLESLSFSYQMKVRSIFTKEQLERLPEDCLPEIGAGYEMFMGIGRGPRRGVH